MTFTPGQKTLLAAPLNRINVKSRSQGGRALSYIEGWKAIEEANRIFDFDGWTRETVEIKCVSEKPRDIGAAKQPGFGVSYIARVRIVAQGVSREGVGAGHGIDRDLGQAHESAIKEAETDAMKRALMTFGNPFGLALYDKDQTNVVDEMPPEKKEFITYCKTTMDTFTAEAPLRDWWNSETQKTQRRDLDLTKEDVTDLLLHMKAKIDGMAAKS